MNTSDIIATCALALTIWQGWLARKHNRISVRPAIEITASAAEAGSLTVTISNHGMGTAKILSAEIALKNRKADLFKKEELIMMLCENLEAEDQIKFYHHSLSNSFLATGSEVAILKLSAKRDEDIDTLTTQFTKITTEIIVIISYECMYGTKFTDRLDFTAQQTKDAQKIRRPLTKLIKRQ